jgi:hypothetical protein
MTTTEFRTQALASDTPCEQRRRFGRPSAGSRTAADVCNPFRPGLATRWLSAGGSCQLGDPLAPAGRVLSARACSPSCAPVDSSRKLHKTKIRECARSTRGTRPTRTTGPLPHCHPSRLRPLAISTRSEAWKHTFGRLNPRSALPLVGDRERTGGTRLAITTMGKTRSSWGHNRAEVASWRRLVGGSEGGDPAIVLVACRACCARTRG